MCILVLRFNPTYFIVAAEWKLRSKPSDPLARLKRLRRSQFARDTRGSCRLYTVLHRARSTESWNKFDLARGRPLPPERTRGAQSRLVDGVWIHLFLDRANLKSPQRDDRER